MIDGKTYVPTEEKKQEIRDQMMQYFRKSSVYEEIEKYKMKVCINGPTLAAETLAEIELKKQKEKIEKAKKNANKK